MMNAIHKTQNGHLQTTQFKDITVFIRARQLKLFIDGQVQWNLDGPSEGSEWYQTDPR